MSAPEHGDPGGAPARHDAPRRAGVLGRRTVGEVVAHAMDELEVRREYGVTGWATGIASLDGRIRQVIAPGRVVCIAGGTKSGKTALAGQIVVALAAQGVPVLLGYIEGAGKVEVRLTGPVAGVIAVLQGSYAPGDAQCCPSKLREQVFQWNVTQFAKITEQVVDNPTAWPR